MDIWYARLSEAELLRAHQARARGRRRPARSGEGSEKTAQKTPRRRARATACRRCRSSAEQVDGRYRIVSQPPIVVPLRDLAASTAVSADEIRANDPRPVPRLPGNTAGRPAAAARAVRGRRHGPQGRRCRQRRHPGVHRAAPGPRPAGSAVPAGQGSDRIGAGGPPPEEPLRSQASASSRASE